MASFMNDWTLDHIAGYEPRSDAAAAGARPTGPGPRHHRRPTAALTALKTVE